MQRRRRGARRRRPTRDRGRARRPPGLRRRRRDQRAPRRHAGAGPPAATWSASAALSLDAPGEAPEVVIERLAELLAETWSDLAGAGARPGRTRGRGRRSHRQGDRHPERSLPTSAGATYRSPPCCAQRLGDPAYPIEHRQRGQPRRGRRGDPRATRCRSDILVIHGEVGVGGGIVADGRQLRGTRGYAGEFGHMTVDAHGRRCGCGRTRLLGDRGRARAGCSTWPPTPTTRCALRRSRLEAAAGRAEPARRASATTAPWTPCAQVGARSGCRRRHALQRPQPRRDRAQRLLRRGRPVAAATSSRPSCAAGVLAPGRRRHHRRAVHARASPQPCAVARPWPSSTSSTTRRSSPRVPEPLEAIS